MKPTTLAIHGAAGRMGQRLVALGHADPAVELVAAIESASSPNLGRDAGVLAGVGEIGVPLSADWPQSVGAVIDFSVPEAVDGVVARCLEHKFPLVIATTGFGETTRNAIEEAAGVIPVCWAPSMSLTVNIAMKLAEVAGRALADHPTGADVEIIERHHRFKEDSPSGTALGFGRVISDAMGQHQHTHGRHGRPGVRPHDEIGYHAVRTGDNPGEHTIVFGLLGETLELRVAATNRDCYASGALVAARWLQDKPAGLYDMQDVLGLRP
ncbi:4-hydroxy-tetrahydrodipicolinate reductase [Pirellulimonas nuda]|uniref:4-hydroxy-tetrahydrodipicolinate reductase n=1 Tax=Pirellulimonas nuda TaxID=2528009 RepID=A0A518D8G7_9BACT|nr:4-hydroxy-tetrahydrodipicolinate reductase [Pirellulimonas nuda]QDU87772.1 4-hydroxy-tetrahydrodipicolinate reductase [Pirellulimonas nuda]